MKARPSILSCGEVLWDLFPDHPRLGGAPANFACHASALGGSVFFLTGLGTDDRAGEAIRILESHGVSTRLIQTIPEKTTGAVDVSFDASGQPRYRIHEDSAWDHLAWTRDLESQLGGMDAIYFGTLGQRSEPSRQVIRAVLERARGSGLMRVLDINLRAPFYTPAILRESVSLATHVKLNDEELPVVAAACGLQERLEPREAIMQLREAFKLRVVALTMGAAGAWVSSDQGTLRQPGFPAEVVDTVGAGDAFTASLTLGLLAGTEPGPALHDACQTASKACTHAGGLPRLD